MAKYIPIQNNRFAYALDECEDYIILDAYLFIKAAKRFDHKSAFRSFEYYHLEVGGTLNDENLVALNGCLQVLGRDPIIFVNGHTTAYATLRDHAKILRREAILDQLRSLSDGHRAMLIDSKRQQAAALPERTPIGPAPEGSVDALQRHEVERRRAALAQAQQIELGTAQAEKRLPLTLAKAPADPLGVAEVVEPTETIHLAEPAPEPITTPAVKVGYNKVRISLDTLSAMRQRVAAAAPKVAPEPDSLNIRQAVAAMYDELADAHGRGVTWDQLAADLSDLGVSLSARTLKQYFGDEKRERGHTRPRKASA